MKLQQLFEMAKPTQVCGVCGQSPIHKTHNREGGKWWCRGNHLEAAGLPRTKTQAQPSVLVKPAAAANGTVATSAKAVKPTRSTSTAPVAGVPNSQEVWRAVATEDYQRRDGQYPKSDVPVTIDVFDNEAMFSFKNTSEDSARKWVINFISSKRLPGSIIGVAQAGDYDDDWVEVWVR